MSFQKITVYGYLGKNAQHKDFGGNTYLSFSIGVDNGKDAQGQQRPTTWFDCLYKYNTQTQGWLLQELVSKARVIAHGNVSARAYINKETNEPVASLNLLIRELEVVGMVVRQNNGQQQGYAPQPMAQPQVVHPVQNPQTVMPTPPPSAPAPQPTPPPTQQQNEEQLLPF